MTAKEEKRENVLYDQQMVIVRISAILLVQAQTAMTALQPKMKTLAQQNLSPKRPKE
jgi:hypothetical protein